MRLQPYVQVDDYAFCATQAQIVALLGQPLSAGRNAVALDELDYGDVVFRYQDSGRLEEITRRAPVIFLEHRIVLFPELAARVRTEDPDRFVRAGFLVSPRFGLAFVPDSPSWVTALAAHCIETWRAL
jgi:hypothetical protein